MDPTRKINLIQIKHEESPQTGVIFAFLQRLSLWALVVFIASGILIGSVYYVMKTRYDQMVITRRNLTEIITQNATKEGLLASIKARTGLINKIFEFQKPVGNVFDLLTAILVPSQITDVTVDEKNTVAVLFHAGSIDEVVSITDNMIKQAEANRIRSPQLISLKLATTGGIDVGLSFVAVF